MKKHKKKKENNYKKQKHNKNKNKMIFSAMFYQKSKYFFDKIEAGKEGKERGKKRKTQKKNKNKIKNKIKRKKRLKLNKVTKLTYRMSETQQKVPCTSFFFD